MCCGDWEKYIDGIIILKWPFVISQSSEPKYIGRVTCGQKSGNSYISCYGRWGSGTNDYDTTRIENPF